MAPVGDAGVEHIACCVTRAGDNNVLTGQGFSVTLVQIGILRRWPPILLLVPLSTGEIMAFTISSAEFSVSTCTVASIINGKSI